MKTQPSAKTAAVQRFTNQIVKAFTERWVKKNIYSKGFADDYAIIPKELRNKIHYSLKFIATQSQLVTYMQNMGKKMKINMITKVC